MKKINFLTKSGAKLRNTVPDFFLARIVFVSLYFCPLFPLPPPLLFFFIQFLFFTSHVLNFLFLFPIPLVIHFLLRSHVSFLLSLRVLPFAIAFILYGVCSTVYFIIFFFFYGFEQIFFFFFCTYFRKFWLFFSFYVCLKICEKENLFFHFLLIFISLKKFLGYIEINFCYSSYVIEFCIRKIDTENYLNIGINMNAKGIL